MSFFVCAVYDHAASCGKYSLMGNNAILNYSDVLDTYAYRYGKKNGMYSYGTAVGFFKSAVSFILVLAANKITAKLNDSALF